MTDYNRFHAIVLGVEMKVGCQSVSIHRGILGLLAWGIRLRFSAIGDANPPTLRCRMILYRPIRRDIRRF